MSVEIKAWRAVGTSGEVNQGLAKDTFSVGLGRINVEAIRRRDVCDVLLSKLIKNTGVEAIARPRNWDSFEFGPISVLVYVWDRGYAGPRDTICSSTRIESMVYMQRSFNRLWVWGAVIQRRWKSVSGNGVEGRADTRLEPCAYAIYN